MNQQQRSLFLDRVEEYRQAQLAIAERPEAHLNLGWLEASQGDPDAAERHYKMAAERDPAFIPAYVNLADLYRAQGRDAEGEEQLRRALELDPEVAELHHSLGLLLVRQNRHEEALGALARAAELAPDQPRFVYVYGVALHDLGHTGVALDVLEGASQRFPSDRNTLMALINFYREAGESEKALLHGRRLLELDPSNPDLQQFLRQLTDSPG